MMEHRSLDPYEQQLLKVFDSYDHDNCGSLDRNGLTQLCHTLQLEEQGTELIKNLLKDPRHPRATFTEFKEALLALLGNMQNNKVSDNNSAVIETDKGSPDREMSPKFVYGSKKYGRRSRPRNDDVAITVTQNNDLNSLKVPSNVQVQRSNSQNDVSNSKKRKTNYKLKRCTSFPTNTDFESDKNSSVNYNDSEFVCTEEMLREAWNKLGVGKDGYLNQTELVLVCDAIGLHKLAEGVIRQLSHKLSLDYNHRISFQELLELLQQDDTWTGVLNTNNDAPLNLPIRNDSIFKNSQIMQYVTLGPDGNGVISIDNIIEMWENAGVTSPKLLLSDLGFTTQHVNVAHLANVLEKEIKGMNEANADFANPHVALLQATLTLYQSEIRCLKSILEQMYAEREKLKCDVAEANKRATLLAQEVDDNHARMEKNTQNQVKLLEQRHSDILKELNEQFASDREQQAQVNQRLEQKIASLENEESKLRSDLCLAQKYSLGLEKDNQVLKEQIQELEQVRDVLTEQIGTLESERQRYMEIEQIEPLLAKLSTLQIENAQLRDRNDEMVSEIECLGNQINAMRAKLSSTPTYGAHELVSEENVSVTCEGVGIGLGSKRRSDESPSKDMQALGLGDLSPRLGKVRKFQKNGDLLDVPFTSSESGFDTEIDCFDSSLSISGNEGEEVTRLQAKISALEQLLKQHSIPIPSSITLGECPDPEIKIRQLAEHCSKLEGILSEVKSKVSKMLVTENPKDLLSNLSENLENLTVNEKPLEDSFEIINPAKEFTDASTETDESVIKLNETIRKYEEENRQLENKCAELENCIDLLRNEYEKCEDYWATKLDEERQMFDLEQAQNTEKLNELIKKMTEYEEQFAMQDAVDSRLPPIEENNLEKQFTDLEQEYEEYKEQSESQLEAKDKEIELLKQKLTELALRQKTTDEKSVQVSLTADSKMSNLSNHVVESTNLFSADTSPIDWCQKPAEVDSDKRDYVNLWDKPQNTLWDNGQSSSSSLGAPCRPKRTRKYDRNSILSQRHKRESHHGQGKPLEEQTCVLPLSVVHNLNGRLHHLEQRCRHLQVVLKQQHCYAEQMLHHYWQQHRNEKVELQYLLKNSQDKLEQQLKVCNDQLERLARTDMLVKDLYVENSYLIANVQRLEQRCHMLAQCNSNSSSV